LQAKSNIGIMYRSAKLIGKAGKDRLCMNILQGIVLGIVQGLTEFLPVSSSGHLVLFQNIMNLDGDMVFFDTMMHVGTLVAVLFVFWADISSILHKPLQKLTGLLIVATIPGVIFTLLFEDFINSAFSGAYLGIGFLVTAALLIAAEWLDKGLGERKKKNIGYPTAVGIGCMQAIAIIPGISRSGSTLAGGLFAGVERNLAARFSFLMSIPIIIGSVVLQLFKLATGEAVVETSIILPTLVGMIFAAVSGFLAIRFMLNLISKHKLYGFAVYMVAIGLFTLLDKYCFGLIF